ncbi:MAG: 4Fe-4S dicluster domain-containing protein, partial [Blastocatellia bacterium]|nr:4Fe-4S dicluster domain-containing protein [Blastocatellia bacterium]
VQCANFAPRTCFCVSMGTGPRATAGYDLALTELLEPGAHRFVAEIGSERGANLLAHVPHRPARAADLRAAEQAIARTATQMGRRLDTNGLKAALYANLEHPRWNDVAERCLTCGNCTMVCPTCFCFSVEDRTDLSGNVTERVRQFDVCFTTAFTYTAGTSHRHSARARYRQWLLHKLATWVDQF